ncbi:MAG: hypothetical protein IMW92_12705 [Bacillales bacterium]|nr:hypothetical protein [Bacillales bacterium]
MAGVTNEMILQAIKESSEQLNNLEIRMDRLESKMNGLEKKMDGLEKRMDSLDKKTGCLEKDVKEMKEQLADIAVGQKILVEELFINKTDIKRVKTALNMY